MLLRYGSYEFSLDGWSTVSSALGIAIFIFLGQWQLERAAQKQALIEEYVNRALQPPVQIDRSLMLSQDIRYRLCVVHGR